MFLKRKNLEVQSGIDSPTTAMEAKVKIQFFSSQPSLEQNDTRSIPSFSSGIARLTQTIVTPSAQSAYAVQLISFVFGLGLAIVVLE